MEVLERAALREFQRDSPTFYAGVPLSRLQVPPVLQEGRHTGILIPRERTRNQAQHRARNREMSSFSNKPTASDGQPASPTTGPAAFGTERPPRTVLVTGGAGFIGSHVTKRLLERGDTVIVVDGARSGPAPRARHPPPRPLPVVPSWPGRGPVAGVRADGPCGRTPT